MNHFLGAKEILLGKGEGILFGLGEKGKSHRKTELQFGPRSVRNSLTTRQLTRKALWRPAAIWQILVWRP